MQCGELILTADGSGGWTTSIGAGARVPASGVRGVWTFTGSSMTASCPAGEAVVGVAGEASGGQVRTLTLRCAPVTVTGDETAGFSSAFGTAQGDAHTSRTNTVSAPAA
ncbi:MAG: hypothetical protein RLP09_05470 [Sandaracinaceae bacterium]